jgi:hypothetical protein
VFDLPSDTVEERSKDFLDRDTCTIRFVNCTSRVVIVYSRELSIRALCVVRPLAWIVSPLFLCNY